MVFNSFNAQKSVLPQHIENDIKLQYWPSARPQTKVKLNSRQKSSFHCVTWWQYYNGKQTTVGVCLICVTQHACWLVPLS